MRGIAAIGSRESLRVRRWDAVVLGGALPGLVAGVRMAMRGSRILVVEEEDAVRAFAALREPFLAPPPLPESVLGHCLRELGVALIERRRIGSDPLAYQVVLPDARLDVGEPARSAEELVAWGLAKPETAQSLVRALGDAAAAEREAMLAWAQARGGRRAASAPPRAAARHARGLPEEVASAEPRLAACFAAQLRALSNLAAAAPPPEARARLLGASQEGAAVFRDEEHGLRPLLRQRIESLYGEFRRVAGGFRFVSASNQPGIALEDSGETWVGRVLVLNAPRRALAAAIAPSPTPDALRGPALTRRRLSLHLRLRRDLLPEGISQRVIRVADTSQPMSGTNVVSLRICPSAREPDWLHGIASAVIDADETDVAEREDEIEAAVRRLMPFSESGVARQPIHEPRWDWDAWLADPEPGAGWPGEGELRVASRPPIYALERAGVAGLGFEGDVLLGWRAGDAIAADLA